MTKRRVQFAGAALLFVSAVAPAAAQLCESQVLVVYDSRIDDSRLIAEYYAGSALVPGGSGDRDGVRRGVRVVDLATLAGTATPPYGSTISHAAFETNFRNPLRTHLTTTTVHGTPLSRTVRCIVLTKGIPHRLTDTDAGSDADQPGLAGTEFNNRDATYSSFDSELTLLFQNLETGEAGGSGDSKLDGAIVNPYYSDDALITDYATTNITSAKTLVSPFTGSNDGYLWRSTASGPQSGRLTAGDILLVCRLDAPSNSMGDTRQVVYDLINRAHGFVYDVDNAGVILDESDSDGLVDETSDEEFDNDSIDTNADYFPGDDYEQTRDALLTSVWNPANIHYNALSGTAEFLVGPLIDYGGGQIVAGDIAYVASYGANHDGYPSAAGTTYATSFQLAPGAVFNTIESYNGRAFGGLGQNGVPQQQASDFLKAGGTFAIGTVWEPFSFTAADNLYVVDNFVLGERSWAEAAWSAIPVLSWQHIVLGDPLAIARRGNDDVNADGRVNVEDLYAYEAAPADVDRSGTTNQADHDALHDHVRSARCETCDIVNGRR